MRIIKRLTLYLTPVFFIMFCMSAQAADKIQLTGTIRDFQSSHPDFQREVCGHIEGMVTDTLNSDKKPEMTTKGNDCIASPDTFSQWFHDVESVNLSKSLSMTFTGDTEGIFTYDNPAFFPIDDELFGNEDNNHNYHFTLELHSKFVYNGSETFSFSGDDDLWVYIDKKLAVDVGGIHGAVSQSINISDLVNRYDDDEWDLEPGTTYDLDIFFAERHTTESNFKIQTSIKMQQPCLVSIDAEAGTGGTISPQGSNKVTCNSDSTYIISPEEGYEIQSVMVDGESITITDNQYFEYEFKNVEDEHAIVAEFAVQLCEIKGIVNYNGDWTGPLWVKSEHDASVWKSAGEWDGESISKDFVLNELPPDLYSFILFIDVNENGSQDTCEPYSRFESECPNFENIMLNLRENCQNPDVCIYTPLKEEQTEYGFTYHFFPSKTNDFNDPTGMIQIQQVGNSDTKNTFMNDGEFQLKIDDESVNLYTTDENLSGSASEIVEYSKGDDVIILYFRLNAFQQNNIDKIEVVLEHKDEDENGPSNLRIFWDLLAYCPPCSRMISVTPEIWPYTPRKRSARQPANRGNYIEVPSKGSKYGDIGAIKVISPEKCNDWEVSTLTNWISLEERTGIDNNTELITFKVDLNDSKRDRTGLITFTSGEKIISQIPVFQKDKSVEQIWINELNENSPLASEVSRIDTMDEDQEVKLTLAVLWDNGLKTKIDSVHNDLIWLVNSPAYANINPAGILKSRMLDGDSQLVRVQACYSYGTHQEKQKTPCTFGSLTINEISIVESVNLIGDAYVNEGIPKTYKVMATMDKEGDVNISSKLEAHQITILPENALVRLTFNEFGARDSFITIDPHYVTRNTEIEVLISFEHNETIYTNENDWNRFVEIRDITSLKRIMIDGKSTIKSDESASYQARADWLHHEYEQTDITDQVLWSLDSTDYEYATISNSGVLTPSTNKIGKENKIVTIQAIYTYKGVQYKAQKAVLIQAKSNWELTISGMSDVSEKSTAQYSATIIIDDGAPQDISTDCIWSVTDLVSTIAEINKGVLSVSSVTKTVNGFVKACYTFEEREKCHEIPLSVIDTTLLDGLMITGSSTIVEGESQQYNAIASWSNENDSDVTQIVQWSVSPAEKANLNSSGLLTINTVEALEQVYVKAVFSSKGIQREYVKSVSLIPKLVDLVIEKVIHSDIHQINEDETTEYLARATFKDGSKRVVTEDCEWSVDGQAAIDQNGLFVPQDIDGDQSVTISASYTFSKETKTAITTITIIDNHPRMMLINGTVHSTEDRKGRLFVDVFSSSDIAFLSKQDMMEFDWSTGMTEQHFNLSVPVNDTYNVSAFIDVNLNGKLDECEAQGHYLNTISEEHLIAIAEEGSGCTFGLVIPDGCPVAGAAIDLNMDTYQYDYTAVTTKHIESTAKPNENGEIFAFIVAQNVTNLDTYQMEISFDADRLKFEEGYEDDFIPVSDKNFLKKNNGTAVGFKAYERKPGIINIASSLIGSDSAQSPDGSGILAVLKFKTRDRKRTNKPDNMIPLKLSNVYFVNSDGINEPITRLKDAYVLGQGVQCLASDFNRDGVVDYLDLNLFADQWMVFEDNTDEWDSMFNLNETPDLESEFQVINYKDLIVFSVNWLKPSFCSDESE